MTTTQDDALEQGGYQGDQIGALGEGQSKNSIISFPLHRRRSLLTLSQRCHAWRSIRCPRGAYKTPLPEDLIRRCCNA